ncbi:MAG: SDR family oxidoreductase [Betaproteobacteria bacterium]|nr:SDR family oxidoreductase [Betaproteobacteria bacterium]
MNRNPPSPRIALVTGAAKRLGKCMALALAEAGWDIVVHYHRSESEAQATVTQIREMGCSALALQADLASPTEASALIPACIERMGLPHCLINNASLFEFDDGQSIRPEMLERHMAINLSAPLVLSRQLYEAHRQQDLSNPARECTPGVIINLLDQKLINLNPDFLSYTLSKAALETATRLLAQCYAPVLRMVGLAPGITLPSGSQSEMDFALAHHNTPLGHASFPEDIAQAAVYLASAHAITGTTLYVDGGQHLRSSSRDIMFKP